MRTSARLVARPHRTSIQLSFWPMVLSRPLEEFRPQPAHAMQLWQVFLDRVNPLTKIVHVPTLQPLLLEATTNPSATPKNLEALLFTIYLMAAISMTDTECQSTLRSSKKSAIDRFSKGTRMALSCADILRTRDFVVLQAMTLYLGNSGTVKPAANRIADWVADGSMQPTRARVRLGVERHGHPRCSKKIGLHQDGELLGLPPFETEDEKAPLVADHHLRRLLGGRIRR